MKKTYSNSKKFFAVLLVLMMVFGLIPFSALSSYNMVSTDAHNMNGLPTTLDVGQVASTKQVEDNKDGTFDITLEVLARQFMTIEEREEASEYDVVFVLDASSSMNDNSRLTNMRTAAQAAIDEILRFNTNDKYNRVSVVTFGSQSSLLHNWTPAGQKALTLGTINPGTSSYTNIMAGANRGYDLLKSARKDVKTMMILLSDGQPNRYYTEAGTEAGSLKFGSANVTGSNSNATDASVLATVKSLAYIKEAMQANPNIGGFEIYTIGFALNSIANTSSNNYQRNYAYVTLNPSYSNPANLDLTGMSGVKAGLAGATSYVGYTATQTQSRESQQKQTYSTGILGIGARWSNTGSATTTSPSEATSAWSYVERGTQATNTNYPSSYTSGTVRYVYYTTSSFTTISSISTNYRIAITPQTRTRTLYAHTEGGSEGNLKQVTGVSIPNYCDQYYDASEGLDELYKVFRLLSEKIVAVDPILGGVVVYDTVDSYFDVVKNSDGYLFTDENGNQVSPKFEPATGNIEWSIGSDLAVLPHDGDGSTVGYQPNTLKFTVQIKDTAVDQTYYTNTANYNKTDITNPNRTEFIVLSDNPYYFNKNGTSKSVPNPANATSGKVRQNLLSTGLVELEWKDDVDDLTISKAEGIGDDLFNFILYIKCEIENPEQCDAELIEYNDDTGIYSYQFTLGYGDSVTFEDIPLGVWFKVVEDLTAQQSATFEAPAYSPVDVNTGLTFSSSTKDVTVTNTRLESGYEFEKVIYSINGTRLSQIPNRLKDRDGYPYVKLGDVIIYRVTLTNTGETVLTVTEWEDPLVAGTNPYGDRFATVVADDPVGQTIPVGGHLTVYYKYEVTEDNIGRYLTNTASVVVEDPDGELPGDSKNAKARLRLPELEITKELADADKTEYDDGDMVMFVVTLSHTDNSKADATGINLWDILSCSDGRSDQNLYPVAVYMGGDFDNNLLDDSTFDLSNFTLPLRQGTITLFYEIEAEGASSASLQNSIDNAQKMLDDAKALSETAINAAEWALNAANEKLLELRAELDALLQSSYSPDPSADYDDSPEFEDGENNDVVVSGDQESIERLNGLINAAEEAVQNAAKTLEDVRVDQGLLVSLAQAALDKALTTTLDNLTYTNTAYFSYPYGDGSDFDSVEYNVTPKTVKVLAIEKFVKREDAENWTKVTSVPVGGGNVEFLIRVTNIGNETILNATVTDEFMGDIFTYNIESLAPGQSDEFIITSEHMNTAIAGNVFKDKYVFNTNRATVTYETADERSVSLTSRAYVYQPPKPAARLFIDKTVRLSSETGPFMDSRTIYSAEAESFDFRIEIKNLGNAAATILLTDTLGDMSYSVADMEPDDGTAGYVDGEMVTIPAGGSAVFYLRGILVESGEAVTNVASYVTEDDAFNPAGEDIATAEVIGPQFSIMSITKSVVNGSGARVDSESVTSSIAITRVFEITVQNTGTVPGQFKLYDVYGPTGSTSGSEITLYRTAEDAANMENAIDSDEVLTVNAAYLDESENTVAGSVIFYYSSTITVGSDMTNTVWITPVRGAERYSNNDYDTLINNAETLSDFASVEVTAPIIPVIPEPPDVPYTPTTTTTITPDPEPAEVQDITDVAPPLADLPDLDVPLAALPPEEVDDVILEDPDVPLSNLPQTGLSTQGVPLAALGFGLAALGAGVILKGKKEEDLPN